jgi:hypothetical protein
VAGEYCYYIEVYSAEMREFCLTNNRETLFRMLAERTILVELTNRDREALCKMVLASSTANKKNADFL